jgi:hypothetical protein
MPEQPPSSSSSSSSSGSKSSVWKKGAKSFNMVASAASNVAKTATGVGGGPSRRKSNDGQPATTYDTTNDSSATISTILEEGADSNRVPRSGSKDKKGMLKTTLNKAAKAANKVNPLRIAAPLKTAQADENTVKVASSPVLHDLGADEAEDAVLSSVEQRSSKTKAGEDGFRPAVEGESPPFSVPTLGSAFSMALGNDMSSGGNCGGDGSTRRRSSPSLKMMTSKVMAMQRLERVRFVLFRKNTLKLYHFRFLVWGGPPNKVTFSATLL